MADEVRNISIDYPENFCNESEAVLKIHPSTKRLWLVLLDLLSKFDVVCKAHHLKYTLVGGSLIGVYRHQGFIPWDDDIDVMMSRSEYEKLCKIAETEFSYPYFFQTNETDPNSARGHAQLRNSMTTGVLKSEMTAGVCDWQFNQGIFLDIFPADNIPDDPIERNRFFGEMAQLKRTVGRLRDYRWVFNRKRLPGLGFLREIRRFVWFLVMEKLFRLDTVSKAYRKMESVAQKYNHERTDCCALITFRPEPLRNLIFHNEDVQSTHYMPFEFLKVQVADGGEKILSETFGDWHRHIIGTSMHGGLIIDVDRPYTDYFKR